MRGKIIYTLIFAILLGVTSSPADAYYTRSQRKFFAEDGAINKDLPITDGPISEPEPPAPDPEPPAPDPEPETPSPDPQPDPPSPPSNPNPPPSNPNPEPETPITDDPINECNLIDTAEGIQFIINANCEATCSDPNAANLDDITELKATLFDAKLELEGLKLDRDKRQDAIDKTVELHLAMLDAWTKMRRTRLTRRERRRTRGYTRRHWRRHRLHWQISRLNTLMNDFINYNLDIFEKDLCLADPDDDRVSSQEKVTEIENRFNIDECSVSKSEVSSLINEINNLVDGEKSFLEGEFVRFDARYNRAKNRVAAFINKVRRVTSNLAPRNITESQDVSLRGPNQMNLRSQVLEAVFGSIAYPNLWGSNPPRAGMLGRVDGVEPLFNNLPNLI